MTIKETVLAFYQRNRNLRLTLEQIEYMIEGFLKEAEKPLQSGAHPAHLKITVTGMSAERAELVRHLRSLREACGMTQADVAVRLGSSISKVIRHEAGQTVIRIDTLSKLLELYGVTDRQTIARLHTLAYKVLESTRFKD